MYDIFFISYDEPMADLHWKSLKGKVPFARHVKGVTGIQAAHLRCAELCRTKFFFVVDADNSIEDESVFEYKVPEWDEQYVHLWYAKNPVNSLCYGWGGIKLFPKQLVVNMEKKLDMTTSFDLKIVEKVASITHFNISAYESWRSAFRECVKLTLSENDEAKERLEVWRTQAEGPFSEWVLKGAQEGSQYAQKHVNDFDELCRINDYNWLYERFIGLYGDLI